MPPPSVSPTAALAVISLAVLLATATWFSGTAVTPALVAAWSLDVSAAATLTTAVQLGFVLGTLLFAAFNLADVFNPRRVFCASALAGAACNAAFGFLADDLAVAVACRFATGVSLAGVYPVGMKLVAGWFDRGLGWQLGVMVGALALGTASPYGLASFADGAWDWRTLVAAASLAAALGGGLVLLLPDGPHARRPAPFRLRMMVEVFAHRPFRYQAIGYFGHMWELYAMWSLVAFFLADRAPESAAKPVLPFTVIALGALGCVVAGWLSRRHGERRVALTALVTSGLLSLTSGLWVTLPLTAVIALTLAWGVAVVADSPQLSALAARTCPPEYIGTALTVQNGIGFAITVVSIQLLPLAAETFGWRWVFTLLAPGPAIGAYFLWRLGRLQQGAVP
ncbi:MAG: MFS transporter [Gammaproteobacteria bacterium]